MRPNSRSIDFHALLSELISPADRMGRARHDPQCSEDYERTEIGRNARPERWNGAVLGLQSQEARRHELCHAPFHGRKVIRMTKAP